MKVLYLSRNYPNPVTPLLGLWVEGLVRSMARRCDVRVVAPVPYCPPLPARFEQTRFRSIASHRREKGIEVYSPRFFVGPGYSTHSVEADSYYLAVRGVVRRLRRKFAFDLIHAQFGYPDGVAGARLAQKYGVPLLLTEHAPWVPWMDDYPRVRRQAQWAAQVCQYQLPVSECVRRTIVGITGDSSRLKVVPVGVDDEVFKPAPQGNPTDPERIVYVGRIHPTKGSDVLFKALRILTDRRPRLRLTVVGGNLGYRHYRLQEQAMRTHVDTLGLTSNIDFVGEHPPEKVADFIREAAVLVLPSRRESFGAVLLEAMASGVPVVATRCGGPEEFVNENVGRLVPIEDPTALAQGVEEVLALGGRFDPEALRRYAVSRFAWTEIARQTYALYEAATMPSEQLGQNKAL